MSACFLDTLLSNIICSDTLLERPIFKLVAVDSILIMLKISSGLLIGVRLNPKLDNVVIILSSPSGIPFGIRRGNFCFQTQYCLMDYCYLLQLELS